MDVVTGVPAVDRRAIHDELEGARRTFHHLLEGATATDLRRATDGTRWTNEQLLFHMLFGYLVVQALLGLVRVFGRLPDGVGRGFARLLDSAVRPFDAVNYLGACVGARVVGARRMGGVFDWVVSRLHRRLDREAESDLRRGMHYPVRWDPFFKDVMTLADVYHYPTQHFDFHRRQLSLRG